MTKEVRAATIPLIIGLAFCALLLISYDTLYEAATASLKLLATTVLPFLIPYAVLSSVIASTLSSFGGKFSVIIAFIIGNVCGAPIGAIQISHFYKCGMLSKKEAGILLPAVSASSPAFCINAVGGIMLNNRRFGLLIWIIQIIVNLTILSTYILKKTSFKLNSLQLKSEPLKAYQITTKAATSICSVLISVVFFSSISAVLADLFQASEIAKTITSSVLEMSGGCELASKMNFPISYAISAFSLGFCGISVAAQIFSCAEGLPKVYYVCLKLITGCICSAVAILL